MRYIISYETHTVCTAPGMRFDNRTQPLGLREGFWASITAIAVVQAELSATRTSARDQFTGAAVGGLISALVVAVAGQHLPTYVVALVLSMLACWVLNVSTAARLAGSTWVERKISPSEPAS